MTAGGTSPRNIDDLFASIETHMRETLVCSPETLTGAKALLDAGLGMPNGNAGYNLVFSVLYIDGNDDAATFWLGTETVTDPGIFFLDRVDAWEHNAGVKGHDATAVVYHHIRDGEVHSAMFIDHKVAEVAR